MLMGFGSRLVVVRRVKREAKVKKEMMATRQRRWLEMKEAEDCWYLWREGWRRMSLALLKPFIVVGDDGVG